MQINETFNIYVHIFLYLPPLFFYSLTFIFSRTIWENKVFVVLVYIYIFYLLHSCRDKC